MYRIGIDIGSSFTKYCIKDGEGRIEKLYVEETPINQKKYFAGKMEEMRVQYPGARIVTCGYGKENVAEAFRNVSELTALACGVNQYVEHGSTVLDIGGQDTKIIQEEDGRLKRFFINDKCAAGCGRFLQNTLNSMKMGLEDIDVSECRKPEITLSSVCAVFAQTEIVELLAKDYSSEEIIRAVLWHVLGQAKALLRKVDCSEILLSGGLSKIKGIERYAKEALDKEVYILEQSSYLSAIGCASIDSD